MREIKIENKQLLKLMQERNVLVEAGQKLAEQGQELENQMKDLEKKFKEQETKQLKMIDRIRPLANKVTESFATGEFEIVRDVIIKDGELFAIIVDQIEEYKKALKQKTSQTSPAKKRK